jgi:hypothetical protein
MSGAPILFHLGLHKTASTTLQRELFVPDYGFAQNDGRDWILPAFVDKAATEPLGAAELAKLHRFVEASHAEGLFPVASHERLSGYPYSGGYDRLSILHRIHGTGLDVRILLIVREQASWLYSAWKQVIMDGGAIGLDEFVGRASHRATVRVPPPRLEFLNYAREIEVLNGLFGARNVCVVPLELMARDFPAFVARLDGAVRGPRPIPATGALSQRNEGRALSTLYANRAMNGLILRSEMSPGGLIPTRSGLGRAVRKAGRRLAGRLPALPAEGRRAAAHKRAVAAAVGSYYDEINARASELISLDLSAYGYRTGRTVGRDGDRDGT